MSPQLFSFLLPFVASLCLGRPEKHFPAPPPSLVAWQTEQDHDFGEIPRGKPVVFDFTFTNRDSAPITIETVRTTCGCTAAEWTQEAILPGETGKISIEYDAYRSGSFNKKIRVFFDRQKKAETLRIRGEVM